MKIRWRQHEVILVNIIAATLLVGYLREIYHTPTYQLAQPFVNNNTPFNLYTNIIFPDLGMGLLVYFTYMILALFSIPRLLHVVIGGTIRSEISFRKFSFSTTFVKVFNKYVWLLLQVVLFILILGTALNAAIYYKHRWLFDYPGFSFFFNKNVSRSQIDFWGSYWIVFIILCFYFLYLLFREIIIHLIEHSGTRRLFRTVICNQFTICSVFYFVLPVFLNTFRIIHGEDSFYPAYYLVTPSLFFMYMSNTYWLFPMKENGSFFCGKIISRLLVSSFFFSLPLVILLHAGFMIAFAYAWAFQLLIITPLTWLLYQQQKDKITQLRGTEKALSKTKTDLQFLRSQINPHFLFNILNTLYGTALQENAERTAGGIQKLGDMMRFMLHENNLDFIDMSKEIEYLKNYIALQKLRTESSPDIVINDDIDAKGCRRKIAPMLLIPFVENAFKHGISLIEKSWIVIKLECTEKNILFEVRNSVHQKLHDDPERERSGIGFKNVIERLKLIYPGKFDVSFNSDEKEFFVQLAIRCSAD